MAPIRHLQNPKSQTPQAQRQGLVHSTQCRELCSPPPSLLEKKLNKKTRTLTDSPAEPTKDSTLGQPTQLMLNFYDKQNMLPEHV
jgi:hypothetical protein